MLALVRRLGALRRRTPALSVGSYQSYPQVHVPVLAYERRAEGERVIVALNFADTAQAVQEAAWGKRGKVLLSTELGREGSESLEPLRLRPHEGVVVRLG